MPISRDRLVGRCSAPEVGFSFGRSFGLRARVWLAGRGAVLGAAPLHAAPLLPVPARQPPHQPPESTLIALLGPPGLWPKATDGPARLWCSGDWPRGGGLWSS